MIRRITTLRARAALAMGGSLLLGLGMTSPAPAAPSEFGAGLAITPLRIEIDDAARGATVMLTNTSERALPVQSRLFAWSQADGEDVYAREMDVVQLRARVGMVFQKPNPFPKSIYENVAYGPRIHGLASSKAAPGVPSARA